MLTRNKKKKKGKRKPFVGVIRKTCSERTKKGNSLIMDYNQLDAIIKKMSIS